MTKKGRDPLGSAPLATLPEEPLCTATPAFLAEAGKLELSRRTRIHVGAQILFAHRAVARLLQLLGQNRARLAVPIGDLPEVSEVRSGIPANLLYPALVGGVIEGFCVHARYNSNLLS